jgi:hypothetical protein
VRLIELAKAGDKGEANQNNKAIIQRYMDNLLPQIYLDHIRIRFDNTQLASGTITMKTSLILAAISISALLVSEANAQ